MPSARSVGKRTPSSNTNKINQALRQQLRLHRSSDRKRKRRKRTRRNGPHCQCLGMCVRLAA